MPSLIPLCPSVIVKQRLPLTPPERRRDDLLGREIERKFLVHTRDWASMSEGVVYRQGYLPSKNRVVVRVRIAGERAFLTVKGPDLGSARSEFEYPIPVADARQMLVELCEKPVIEKVRHRIDFGGHAWEVDVFHGDNEGLVLAEVELGSIDEPVALPPWAGKEVTGDSRYFNCSLVTRPYRIWDKKDTS